MPGRGRFSRAVIVVGAVTAAGSWAAPCRAQEQSAPAQSLFEEGRALLAQKRYAEACPKLAESERLDPAVGTLLNLGDCYEKMGKIATAWAVFKDAASMAHTARQQSREKLASGRASALEPTIPRLTLRVRQPPAGLEVRRDGVVVGAAEWTLDSPSAVTMDPGEHALEATAPGRKAWSTKVTLAADGATTAVDVPALEVDELAERAPLKPAASGGVSVEAVNTHDRNVQRIVGVSIGAVGLVTLIVSAPLGAIAVSSNNAAKKECPTNTTCTTQGASDAQTAVRDGTLSSVLIGVGAGIVVGGVVVFLTAPSATRKATTGFRLLPQVGSDGRSGGVLLSGAF